MSVVRILQVVGNLQMGGAETMIINVYRQIDKKKIQFDFLVYGDVKSPYAEIVKQNGGRVIVLEKKYARNPIAYFIKLRNIVKKYGPYKGIHAHMDSHNAISLSIARLLKIPVRISHSHTTLRSNSKGFFRKIYYALTGFFITHNATLLLSCGRSAGMALYGKKKYDIVYNPINIDSFVNVDCNLVERLKEQLNISQKKIIIGMVGRLNEVKNHLFAIEIATKLKKYDKDFVLLLAGEGPLRSTLEFQIQKNSLENNVLLLGSRKDVPVLFKCINVLLMPSKYEGFPVTLIEAQAAGVPALISDNITDEADLGFGLLHRCSLKKSAEVWADILLNLTTEKNVSDLQRIRVLKEKGFDSKESVHTFEKFYAI